MRLKNHIMAILLLCGMSSVGQSIWTNPITGTDPGYTSPFTSGDVADPNITVSGISRGTVHLTPNDGDNRYNSKGWNAVFNVANRYYEFTLTPNAGYRIDFSSFVYTGQSSGKGPVNFVLRSSVDGYASNIGVANATGTTISLNAAAFQNRTTATTFRFYAWAAPDASGTFSINDFTFNGSVNATCLSVPLTSVLPTNGPVGTEVTIAAASGLTGATATIGGVTAPIVSTTDTQLVVTVPTGAATGNLIVRNAALCASSAVPFTVINQDLTSCEGSTLPTELFISEVTDSNYGSMTYIEVFNGTGTTKLLSNYSIRIASNGGGYSAGNTVTLSAVNLPSGNSFVLAVGVDATICSTPGGNGSLADQTATSSVTSVNFASGGHDHIALFRGSTHIDSWGTFGSGSWAPGSIGTNGATFRRKNNVVPLPNTTYANADWDILDYAGSGSSSCANNDYTNIGVYATFKSAPNLTLSPSVAVSCTTTSVTLTAGGTEGVANGPGIAYQWYYLAAGSNTWTVVPNSGIYSGAATSALTINPITTVNNYQYYCQIRENTATCFKASDAVIIKDVYSTTWAGTWSNGAPSLTKRAVIAANYDTALHGSFECCSLTVNAGFTLEITPSEYVSIQNNLSVIGTLNVQDDGSLVQISNTGVNTGNINVKRNVSMRHYDYVYWSSPVSAFPVTSVSPGTLAGFIYKWMPTQSGNFGIWTNANENMVAGKGYIIRGQESSPMTFSTFTASFTGAPHNGVITPTVQRGSYTGGDYPSPTNPTVLVSNKDDNYNLIGNPYPSSIYVLDFLTANTNIEGAVRLWTHGALPNTAVTDPFYGNYMYNYNSNDYIVYNGTGTTSGPTGFNGYVASGQGFFVQMVDGAAVTQTVTFNNSMRSSTYGNSQFYKVPGQKSDTKANITQGDSDSGRIWLDLIGPSQVVSRTLIGYINGATLDKDRLYDANAKRDNGQNLYSLIGNDPMIIQGRPLPFDDTDVVPVGVNVSQAGNYKIAIAAIDGILDGATPVFLEDKLLGITHDLKQAPYEFTIGTGTLDTRFLLRYTSGMLGSSNFDAVAGDVVVATNNRLLSVKSYIEPIAEIMVYDIAGRQILHKEVSDANVVELEEITARQQTLILKIKLTNGQIVTRKTAL